MESNNTIADAGLAVSVSQPISKRLSEMRSSRRTLVLKRASDAPEAAQRGYLAAACGVASPRAGIKAFCMMCVCWQRVEVTLCTAEACPLWTYRPFQVSPTGNHVAYLVRRSLPAVLGQDRYHCPTFPAKYPMPP